MAKKKKKDSLRIYKVILILLLLTMTIWVIREWWISRQSRFVRYEAFGIDLPRQYEIHGIDVSRYQQRIKWDMVKSMQVEEVKIGFAFIKATEGLKNVDRQFKRNWREAQASGLPRGAYHFFLATKSGRGQAENFIRNVQLEPGDLPPVLDVEVTYGVADDLIRERVSEWLNIVEEYYGVKPIIYTNVDFYTRRLKDDFDEYPLWIAHYLEKRNPRIYRDWHFWQHSETGRVNGIKGNVDFNVFNGDSADFRQLLIRD